MKIKTCILGAALFVLGTSTATAQYPLGAAGFQWSTAAGSSAGTFCWGFACIPERATVAVGDVVTLRVSGELGAPYLILLSAGASQCQSFPGVVNSLVIDPPLQLAFAGTLAQHSPILACPPGYDTITFPFPPGLPPGSSFALQALTQGAGNLLAFTIAIHVTVL